MTAVRVKLTPEQNLLDNFGPKRAVRRLRFYPSSSEKSDTHLLVLQRRGRLEVCLVQCPLASLESMTARDISTTFVPSDNSKTFQGRLNVVYNQHFGYPEISRSELEEELVLADSIIFLARVIEVDHNGISVASTDDLEGISHPQRRVVE